MWMKGWYKDRMDRALLLTWVTVKWIMGEQVDFYRNMPPPWG